jgi:predicted dehydrogenase
MKAKKSVSRRQFLATAAAATAPMILPQGVLAINGRPGANDRIVTGHIGVGGQGRGLLNPFRENAGMLCDVDSNQVGNAMKMLGRELPTAKDFREVLDRNDIDAVVIAAPDHWHGIMSVWACEAGKDVYCEKPASRTIEEGQKMIKAVRRYGRIMQIGSQGRSTPAAQAAFNYIQNGMLGEIKRIDCWHVENWTGGDPNKTSTPPAELDWDLWLGPQRWVPYNEDRVHFNFRWMLDYGDGFIRDRGAHVFSVMNWVMGLDLKAPYRVSATGQAPTQGLWDVPITFDATFEYKNPDLLVTWSQPGERAGDHDFGAVYHGTKDTLIIRGGDGGTYTEDKAMQYVPPTDGKHARVSPGHQRDFLDAVKSRKDPIMTIEAGHRVATQCNLAAISYKIGRPVEWDIEKELFVGDAEANALISNPGRGPWHI